ncbi:MAG: ergothioneine biosynthesis protein EgtB [Rhodobacteraceae bacterium]|nr:ergothioneine biosynthesis protein EgtB [Paracoccaceae bacterium]
MPRSPATDAGKLAVSGDRAAFIDRIKRVRAATVSLTDGLIPEDMTIQSMPDVSPTKWHLAHTTWFFETFVLIPHGGARPFHPHYGYLFNSYYEAAGARHPRPERGLIARPSVADVVAYRDSVDDALIAFVGTASGDAWAKTASLIELGLHHEEQHQELILMDIKHVLSQTPLNPVYRAAQPRAARETPAANYVAFDGGKCEIGHAGAGFAFDNECPRHAVWLQPFALMDRLVTCGEYLDFIADGGYRRPELWLSDGWAAVQSQNWHGPLYWRETEDGGSRVFTLHGERALDPAEPVVNVSHYEADAYARWAGARLPTEFEWEHAAVNVGAADDAARPCAVHPAAAQGSDRLCQLFGEVWQWTASAYLPYPGFKTSSGAVGEYNGKFMSNQVVLRGSAAITPPGHARATYRNFFPPHARWCFGGIRLAREV